MAVRTYVALCVGSMGIVLGSVANAGAASITWSYLGAVTPGFPSPVLPVGTPVTFDVTADPDQDLAAGSSLPDFMGAYLTTVSATMAGVHYVIAGAIEVNGDPVFGVPTPGNTNFREFSESTDQGFFYTNGQVVQTIAYVWEPRGFAPDSPALLMPYRTFDIALFVAPTGPGDTPHRVNVSGHLVPEPGTLTLLGIGAALAAARARRLRRGTRAAR